MKFNISVIEQIQGAEVQSAILGERNHEDKPNFWEHRLRLREAITHAFKCIEHLLTYLRSYK